MAKWDVRPDEKSDSRILGFLRQMLEAGCMRDGRVHSTTEGVPQGGGVFPLLSNILLTPFDREMRERGYRLTRYADDWALTCRTRQEAEQAFAEAKKVLRSLGVTLNERKTRIVHISRGFEFLGYKLKRGSRPLRLSPEQIRSGTRPGSLYVYPTDRAIERFKDQVPSAHGAKRR